MIATLLLLAASTGPQSVTVLQLRSWAEPYLDKRVRVCGQLATHDGEPYLKDKGLYDMTVGVMLRGKWNKTAKGRTCIVGRMMRTDGKRPGDPQYYTSSLPDAPIHPSYYLLAE